MELYALIIAYNHHGTLAEVTKNDLCRFGQ